MLADNICHLPREPYIARIGKMLETGPDWANAASGGSSTCQRQ